MVGLGLEAATVMLLLLLLWEPAITCGAEIGAEIIACWWTIRAAWRLPMQARTAGRRGGCGGEGAGGRVLAGLQKKFRHGCIG